MAARSEVFIEGDRGDVRLWKTDLTGHGDVAEGDEFVIRQVEQFGKPRLVKGGIKRRVRVRSVRRESRSYHVLSVDVVEDLTPQLHQQRDLF